MVRAQICAAASQAAVLLFAYIYILVLGRQQAELVELMFNFKNGKRSGTVMPQIAKGYSDAQILAMAAWFADQK